MPTKKSLTAYYQLDNAYQAEGHERWHLSPGATPKKVKTDSCYGQMNLVVDGRDLLGKYSAGQLFKVTLERVEED